MRLWTIHPKFLDPAGLVALWREALLAQAVLCGRTKGYRHHPQLFRFRQAPDPLGAISCYLDAVQGEAASRGYRFDKSLIVGRTSACVLDETDGQLRYEWEWLGAKLAARNAAWKQAQFDGAEATPHPLFRIVPGPVRDWEKLPG